MIVWTKTNNVPGETTVEIRHADGGLYWARSYSEANTTYRDTIVLNQGCYRFTVNDSGDDGIDFWVYFRIFIIVLRFFALSLRFLVL